MNIIKLDAIGSTNTYLKDLLAHVHVENYTIVVAEHQTDGKGQRGASWEVEAGSNLTFSVLIKDLLYGVASVYDLNVAVCLGVFNALKALGIKDLAIKWPNDILSEQKKIAGILIENSIKSNGEVSSVVGIGVNVNQVHFENLAQASSLRNILGNSVDKEQLMLDILHELQENAGLIRSCNESLLWNHYHQHLFRIHIPTVFELPCGERIMGIIRGVDKQGALLLEREGGTEEHFYLKEIKMLY